MWYTVENGADIAPAAVEATSSRAYVYVRRNIERVEATEDMPAHYRWQETKIPRDALTIYEQVVSHEGALDDVYAALTELAGLIVGEVE